MTTFFKFLVQFENAAIPPETPSAWMRLTYSFAILLGFIPSSIGGLIDHAFGWDILLSTEAGGVAEEGEPQEDDSQEDTAQEDTVKGAAQSRRVGPIAFFFAFIPSMIGVLIGEILDYGLRIPQLVGHILDSLLIAVGIGGLVSKNATLFKAFESAKQATIRLTNQTSSYREGFFGFVLGFIPHLLECGLFHLSMAPASVLPFVQFRIALAAKKREDALKEVEDLVLKNNVDLFDALHITSTDYALKNEKEIKPFIECAYKKAALTCHPDKMNQTLLTLEKSRESFERAQKAKAILEDRQSFRVSAYLAFYRHAHPGLMVFGSRDSKAVKIAGPVRLLAIKAP